MTAQSIVRPFDERKIDAIFSALDQCHQPGAAVGIAVEGVPVYRKGFGLANVDLPVVLSPSMRMRIGSTTKHFTALAFMLLCEEGRSSPGEEIGAYLPHLHEASRHVTMLQLMGHTSGIRDVFNISLFFHGPGRPISDRQLLDYYRVIDDVDFLPGTSWCYNNGGYLLLSAAIETITGQSLDEVLRTRILEPIGMRDTMLRRWDTDFVPNSATLHMADGQGRFSRDYLGLDLSGAGGLVSTMDDMLRWLRHMDAPIVGSADTWREMWKPHRLANATFTDYGLGLITGRYRGVATISHAGGVLGGNSQMIKVPAVQLDISVAANRADADSMDLANKIIDVCVDGLERPDDLAGGMPRLGLFRSNRTGRVVELTAKGTIQLVSVDGGMSLPISPDSTGVLRLPPAFAFLQQAIRLEERSLCLIEFGVEEMLDEIERCNDLKLGPLAGYYRADSIAVTVEVLEERNGACLKTQGRYGCAEYDLIPLTSLVWHARTRGLYTPMAGIVTFTEDGGAFTLTASRMRGLRFKRVVRGRSIVTER